jgi:hypothetical protein
MSYWRIARDPMPDDPNPHPWRLDRVVFAAEFLARSSAQREEDELRDEYGDDYVADNIRWLVVEDEGTVSPPVGS